MRTLVLSFLAAAAAAQFGADVIVYGSTPGAIMAAVAAARADPSMMVMMLDPAVRHGGMCAGGLGATDKGDTFAIGGLAHEFFLRVARNYNASTNSPLYYLEPHVAEAVFETMLNITNLAWVKLPDGLSAVTVQNQSITSVTDAEFGIVYSGSIFIDGSYEGDMLAMAGATMAIGREANTTYNESFAGRRQPYSSMDWAPISPFDNVTGQLLSLATDAYAAPMGSGDDKVQDYNFRLCVTKNASNMIPFPKPDNYNASYWQLLRNLAAVVPPSLSSYLNNIQPLPNGKYDMNNGGIISTDFAGGSWAWPFTSNQTERKPLWQAHYDYQTGFLWTLANDPAIPAAVRAEMGEYGLCADEFVGNKGWPEQVYVREARRLVGDVVLTQQDVQARTDYGNASIGLGSYAFDGHYSHRGPCIPHADGKGCDMWTQPTPPPAGTTVWLGGEGYPGPQMGLYQIPYSVLLPKRSELTNALAVTTPSASHVAFCSLRMEPQFMIMGHAAGDAAVLALRGVKEGAADGATVAAAGPIAVQDVSMSALHAQLAKEGAVLCHNNYPKC